MDKRLSIDVGGSAIKYALMGEQHRILEQGKVPAPREVREEFVEAIGSLYDRYADQIDGMGVSMAGKVNQHTGEVVSAGSFPFFTGRNLVDDLHKRCPTHITVDNDARCAAIAEMNYGSLVGVDNALVVVLGTGIGGAIIANGRLLDGARYCAAELSFIRVSGQAAHPTAGCGKEARRAFVLWCKRPWAPRNPSTDLRHSVCMTRVTSAR